MVLQLHFGEVVVLIDPRDPIKDSSSESNKFEKVEGHDLDTTTTTRMS
jgi:hypothetical protein